MPMRCAVHFPKSIVKLWAKGNGNSDNSNNNNNNNDSNPRAVCVFVILWNVEALDFKHQIRSLVVARLFVIVNAFRQPLDLG